MCRKRPDGVLHSSKFNVVHSYLSDRARTCSSVFCTRDIQAARERVLDEGWDGVAGLMFDQCACYAPKDNKAGQGKLLATLEW